MNSRNVSYEMAYEMALCSPVLHQLECAKKKKNSFEKIFQAICDEENAHRECNIPPYFLLRNQTRETRVGNYSGDQAEGINRIIEKSKRTVVGIL